MSDDARAILAALDALGRDLSEVSERIARLETGLELVRRHVVALGQRTTALEGASLTPLPEPAAAA